MLEILTNSIAQFNWVDMIFILFLVALMATNSGFITGVVNLSGLTFSFIISIYLYEPFAQFLHAYTAGSIGILKAASFFIIWVLAEIFFFTIFELLVLKLPKIPHKLNKALGGLPALIDGVIMTTLIFTLAVTVPIAPTIKRQILDSKTAPPMLAASNLVESRLRVVFNDAIIDTLNFLTVRPTSQESVDLGFYLRENEVRVDTVSEIEMFNLLNRERKAEGLPALKFDESLRTVARSYAMEMVTHGFFSHTSQVDGSSPDERVRRAGISFVITGENLAFAPDVHIAHSGLMNSEGHRANILEKEFGRVGIGVINAGTFGEIFVQAFAD